MQHCRNRTGAGGQPAVQPRALHQRRDGRTWTKPTNTTRNPLLLLRLSGLLLLRAEADAFL
ncbi:MAG: hypothetical protein KDI03_12685 [Anaerolineae bacterium]|nr:hypothetical protein [Anaerolineae bacterium]